MNRWNIPQWLEKEVSERDTHCIYCGVEFSSNTVSRKSKASWEHIVNDARIIIRQNIALCCISCNASKGTKSLADWLNSSYCEKKGITESSIAQIAKEALVSPPTHENA